MPALTKPDSCRDCSLYDPPFGKHWGYVPADGTGRNGVLIVLEAAGKDEEATGLPTVGRAGHYLWSQLKRIDLERDDFRIHNVLSCRPPENKLRGMPYTDAAIAHCAPNLDATIADMQERCRQNGKHLTILTLGDFALRRVLHIDQKAPFADYLSYVHWSDEYQAHVIGSYHPSHFMQGKGHLLPILHYAARKAVEIAAEGFTPYQGHYLCDPAPETFAQWVRDYRVAAEADPEGTYLAFDIETPYKQGMDEEELAKEEGDDYHILRCSFAYRAGEAVSVPWMAEYMPYLEDIFSTPWKKLAHNANYDTPRICQHFPINGTVIDTMVAWHVVNSTLPKGLGFITPFYVQGARMWKNTSKAEPARYNAIDSDMTIHCWNGIQQNLKENRQWEIFQDHVIRLNQVLAYMSGKGILLDQDMRREAEKKLADLLDVVELNIQATVPPEARRLHPPQGYKKAPKVTDGLVQHVFTVTHNRCQVCGVAGVGKAHIRAKKKGNPCEGAALVHVTEQVERWAKPLEFKDSKVQLLNYQKTMKHMAVVARRERKVTFDEGAILKLMKQYPLDPLYPLLLDHREYQKLLSTYIGVTGDGGIKGGMPVGRDGRISTTYSHNPSTLRLASQSPNMQNLPRPGGPNDLASMVRGMIVAGPGQILTARDFSGIEAVLVGYEAKSPRYIRLAKIDVHSYYTIYALHELSGWISANDLPSLEWDDAKLIPHLAAIKKEYKHERNSLYKHLIHAANFGQTPSGAQAKVFTETRVEHAVKKLARLMAIYRELFPEIPRWQTEIQLQADRDGFLRNAFGYIHRFYRVFAWAKEHGQWIKRPGDDADKVLAFKPQSNAAGIIKEAMLRLFFNRFEEAGQYLRLTVHDELLCECPEGYARTLDGILTEEMERPIKQLALPASYGMGTHLVIGTEGKQGKSWGTMS